MTLNFVLDGKSYKYELFEFSATGQKSGSTGGIDIYQYTERSFDFKSIETSILPLALALEVPVNPTSFTKTGTLNGKPITISWVPNFQFFRITSTLTNKSFSFKNHVETPNNVSELGSDAFGYNWTHRQYCIYRGGQGFRPVNNGNPYPHDTELSEDWLTGNVPPTDKSELKSGYIYQSLFPPDTANDQPWKSYAYTAYISTAAELQLFLEALDIKVPTYPNPPEPEPEPDIPTPDDGDTESEPIPLPPKPIIDVTGTGMVVLYNPTQQQVAQLARFMWSGEYTDLIKKMFGSPFEALISLKMLFADIPSGNTQTVWLGNVETTVQMSKITSQFIDVNMGSINVSEFFGSFADYAPYTKIQIFLPFIGYKDLNVDEVMNSKLTLVYRIDVYSGACIAFLSCQKTILSTQLNSILYQFDGNCAMEIPLTSNDNTRYISALLGAASSSALSLANTSSFSPPQVASGFQKGEKASLQLGSLAPVANGMLDVLSVKPNVQRAGSLAGAVAAMGIKTPYIIIHRPIAQIPTDYQHYYGIPLNLSMQLSKLSGFTVVSQIFFQSQIATEREIDMITELLRNGVIF